MFSMNAYAHGLLTEDHYWKVLMGGRGAGRSTAMCQAALIRGFQGRELILCGREVLRDLDDSMYSTMAKLITSKRRLDGFYDIQRNKIIGANGTKIIFRGMSRSRGTSKGVRSLDGITLCLIDEGQYITPETYEEVLPTIREEGAQIWAALNPRFETDPLYKVGVAGLTGEDPDVWARFVNYNDNQWWSKTSEKARLSFLRDFPNRYNHIYLGQLDDDSGGAAVVPMSLCRLVHDEWDRGVNAKEGHAIEAGYDCADQGQDLNSLTIRQGPCIIHWETWSGRDRDMTLFESVEKAVGICHKWGVNKLWYDLTGMGAGVRGDLHKINPDFEHEGITWQASAAGKDSLYTDGVTNGEAFYRRPDQLAWGLRLRALRTQELVKGDVDHDRASCLFIRPEIGRVRELLANVGQPTWKNAEGAQKIRVKKAQQGQPSPDGFDSTILAFASDSEHGLSHGAFDVDMVDLWDMMV